MVAILGTDGQYGDRERLLNELDHMKSIGHHQPEGYGWS
jgi:hypothetical protein